VPDKSSAKEAAVPDLKPDTVAPSLMCEAWCTKDADCTGGLKKCDTATGICKSCEKDTDCVKGLGNTGHCNTTFSCNKCTSNADCTTAYPFTAKISCQTATGICINCTQDSNCTKGSGNTGLCATAAGSCLKCTVQKDCDDALGTTYPWVCK
jgi:hypothetical protein